MKSENISDQSMKEIVKVVLKTLRAEQINDESAYKKWETLSKDVENLKATHGKMEKEIKTVNTLTDQILTTVNKDFENKVNTLVNIKDDIKTMMPIQLKRTSKRNSLTWKNLVERMSLMT